MKTVENGRIKVTVSQEIYDSFYAKSSFRPAHVTQEHECRGRIISEAMRKLGRGSHYEATKEIAGKITEDDEPTIKWLAFRLSALDHAKKMHPEMSDREILKCLDSDSPCQFLNTTEYHEAMRIKAYAGGLAIKSICNPDSRYHDEAREKFLAIKRILLGCIPVNFDGWKIEILSEMPEQIGLCEYLRGYNPTHNPRPVFDDQIGF